ncbi:MAG: type II secretion system F family protein [Thermoplasmatota archaeon]
MAVSGFQRTAFRYFGKRAQNSKTLPDLQRQLVQARISVRAELYLASAWFVGAISAIVATVLFLLGVTVAVTSMGVNPAFYVLVAVGPLFGWYLGSFAILSDAPSKAKKRGKDIDMRLPFATNYIAAMSSAGVIPAEVFRSLARQPVYGAVTEEAAWIYKDLEVHGKDIVTAMRRAMDRSPSQKFQDLIQGAVTTITSGGDLTAYFSQKATRLQWENRIEQRTFIETMGLMAEAYVTAAVAGPLFLLVMVSIFVLMGSGEMSMMQMLIFGLLPVINIGFIFGLKSMIPET